MSVTQVRSNAPIPAVPIWIITVIVIVIAVWPAFGRTVGVLSDALAVTVALTAGGYLRGKVGRQLIPDARKVE
ncbi:hypothetical protein [Streptomyces sp. NPDC007940]|uniref:hypothetical protein n=1 Tax=Streptomyces sp. NPDC007940 TaxID=3364796 RepID=UPI0036E39F5B